MRKVRFSEKRLRHKGRVVAIFPTFFHLFFTSHMRASQGDEWPCVARMCDVKNGGYGRERWGNASSYFCNRCCVRAERM